MNNRRAYFIRHAKSSWADPTLKDFDRPLNKRGLRDGPNMASKMKSVVDYVDLALCSPAVRTRATMSLFANEITFGNIVFNKHIYHAWPDALVQILQELDDDLKSIMVFGHNPGFTEVFNLFAKAPIANLPTCGIFELECRSTWDDMDTTNTDARLLMYPKMFVRK